MTQQAPDDSAIRATILRWQQENQDVINRKRQVRMQKIDRLSPQLRALVHSYGFYVVNSFLETGITNHRHIRNLVEVVLDEFSPTRSSNSAQGMSQPREYRECAK